MTTTTTQTSIPLPTGEALDAHFLSPNAPIPGILFIHGWGGSQQFDLRRAHHLAGLGCICLTFDLTGHTASGQQRANITREQNLIDVCAAYDALIQHPFIDATSVAVVGHSYGGYLACLLTQHRPIRWLSLFAPALYQDEEWLTPKDQLNKDFLRTYRRHPHTPTDNQALQACSNFQGDVLLLEAEQDQWIPKQTIHSYRQSFLAANSITHRILYGADHGLSIKSAQRSYSSLLYRWIQEMVIGARLGQLSIYS